MTDAQPSADAAGQPPMLLLKPLIRQFLHFAAVGLVGTAAHYSVLIALHEWLGVDPVIASSCGFITGGFVNYYLNYTFTFRSNKRHHAALAQFFTIAGIGLGVNTALMALLVKVLALPYLPAQIATTGLVLVWHFLGNRFWTFR